MKIAFLALWIGLVAASAENLRSLQRRKLPLTDLFVAPTTKATKKKDKSDFVPVDGGEDSGDDYYYYYYYDDQYYKQGGKMNMGKGGNMGKGSSYDDYYQWYPTHAPNMPVTKHPTPSHPTYPPKQFPPTGKGKGSMSMSMGMSKSKDYGKQPTEYPHKTKAPSTYYPPTKAPSNSGPTPTMAPASSPTPPTPTPPTPTPPTPTPPTPTTPTAAPDASVPATAPPTSSPGGPSVIQLTDFSIEYDIAPVVIPPVSDIEAVAQETVNFLTQVFQEELPGFETLGLNFVGEDLSFPTYTIDYEAVVTMNDDTTREELDAVLNSAFQGARLQQYLELIQALPPENTFSSVTGIRKIDTPQNRSTGAIASGNSSSSGLPVSLLAAAGAASFALIVLGITLNRREKKAMREGKQVVHRADMTVAGDTYAGETYAETVNSAVSKGTKSHSSQPYQSGYESAVRPVGGISSSSSEGYEGYCTESDYESGYEEEKVEMEDDDRSLSEASFSRYGGVVPVEMNSMDGSNPRMSTFSPVVETASYGTPPLGSPMQTDGGENDSMNSTIRSGASGMDSESGHSRHEQSTHSGDTSIHILEAVSSDDDDLIRARGVRQSFSAHYTSPGEIQIHIPSVEQDDYEGLQESNDESYETIASQLGAGLQREPGQALDPIQERQPDPPEETPVKSDKETDQAKSGKMEGNQMGVAALIQKFN